MEVPQITFPPVEGASFLARAIGAAPRFDVMAALEKGPVCYTKVLGKRIYFVNDGEYVKRILLDNLANYPKSVTYRNNLRPFLGDGLLISATQAASAAPRRRGQAPDHSQAPRRTADAADAAIAATATS